MISSLTSIDHGSTRWRKTLPGYRGPVITLAALGLVLALTSASPIRAGVSGSPHDLEKDWNTSFQGACGSCHYPSKSMGLGTTLPPDNSGLPDYRGAVARNCSSCHSPGGGLVVSAETAAPFPDLNPNTHGRRLENHPDGIDQVDTTLHYVAPSYYEGRRVSRDMQCTTCHNVHDNALQPFLQDSAKNLCPRCHRGRLTTDSLEAPKDTAPIPGPGQMTPCTSCHRGHGPDPNGRSLLIEGYAGDLSVHRGVERKGR
jgi:predicted CXXCH cytochrome family protein